MSEDLAWYVAFSIACSGGKQDLQRAARHYASHSVPLGRISTVSQLGEWLRPIVSRDRLAAWKVSLHSYFSFWLLVDRKTDGRVGARVLARRICLLDEAWTHLDEMPADITVALVNALGGGARPLFVLDAFKHRAASYVAGISRTIYQAPSAFPRLAVLAAAEPITALKVALEASLRSETGALPRKRRSRSANVRSPRTTGESNVAVGYQRRSPGG